MTASIIPFRTNVTRRKRKTAAERARKKANNKILAQLRRERHAI